MNGQNGFYNTACIELHRVLRMSGKSGDIAQIPDLSERGKRFIMTWLRDERLKNAFSNDPKMYYYNVACNVFCGGIAYADAWDKDIAQVKAGFVDTLLAAQSDLFSLACDILGLDGDDKNRLHKLEDDLFSVFLQLLEPCWEKEDPRPYLFCGLLAFFQTGVSYRMDGR